MSRQSNPVPILWRISLRSAPERVFDLLTTDVGRATFWAEQSRAERDGFHLVFPGGVSDHVRVIEADRPRLLRIRYFGADIALSIEADGTGSILTVHDPGAAEDDEADYLDRYAGWVSWLLILKGAADFALDLRNRRADRTWRERFVDQ